jgi:polygalacturonase
MRNVNLVNPAAWTSAWLYCEDIVVEGVRIESQVNWNGDGLDFDGCRNVRVYGCSFDTSDDSICLQASRAESPCKDVTVSDCVFVSKWAGMRIGMSSMGDFENVVVSNCVFRDISDAGLKIQMCEGGIMKNMVFSNLVMQKVPRPVFMTFNRFRLGVDTPQETPPMKSMGHMQFNNICVDNSDLVGTPCGFVLSGVPGHYIEDITFHNVTIRVPGGGTPDDAAASELPAFVDQRPEFFVLGDKIPFSGFFARHVRQLTLSDIRIETARPDVRPAVMCSDVDGLTTRGMDFIGEYNGSEKMRLVGVRASKSPDK